MMNKREALKKLQNELNELQSFSSHNDIDNLNEEYGEDIYTQLNNLIDSIDAILEFSEGLD